MRRAQHRTKLAHRNWAEWTRLAAALTIGFGGLCRQQPRHSSSSWLFGTRKVRRRSSCRLGYGIQWIRVRRTSYARTHLKGTRWNSAKRAWEAKEWISGTYKKDICIVWRRKDCCWETTERGKRTHRKREIEYAGLTRRFTLTIFNRPVDSWGTTVRAGFQGAWAWAGSLSHARKGCRASAPDRGAKEAVHGELAWLRKLKG